MVHLAEEYFILHIYYKVMGKVSVLRHHFNFFIRYEKFYVISILINLNKNPFLEKWVKKWWGHTES